MIKYIKRADAVSAACKVLDKFGGCKMGALCPDVGCVEVRDIIDTFNMIEIPDQHGRLIDADALTVKLQRHREYHSDGSKSGAAISNGIGQCLDIINGKECPTIIPAEEATS